MNKEELLKRLQEIVDELKGLQDTLSSDEEVNVEEVEEKSNKLIEEKRSIESKLKELDDAKAKRNKLLNDIAEGRKGTVIKEFNITEEKGEERKMNEDKLYRSAFLKNLLGQKLTEAEERAFVHTTENTEVVVPEELQNKIYSTMEEIHPILADIQYLRTGTVISIVKHTAIVAGDAKEVKEGEANDDEQNTFVNVSLSGKDFSKHVDFSYRLGKMAIPAFEEYLVKEIGDRLASVVAKEVIAQMKLDINVENKQTTVSGLTFEDVTKALGSLKKVGTVNVYANNTSIYGDIVNLKGETGRDAFVPDYSNDISGRLLGKAIKEEDALADNEILIVDASQFIWNEVQPLLIERDKNIKSHVHTIAGIIIGEGVLTNDKAGVIITVTPATPTI
ncbi:phage major capsid protein [Helcococcus kunzii]|uniref:phage major capsid protein n=1 Tax=Helcococcus kunzii TaxID=40091 RepID=UPI001BB0C8BD|nr:phage major capsid protein [Helcococcus kunzii]QUY64288.1 phage major capsid protein [Helcococcus kunzii]